VIIYFVPSVDATGRFTSVSTAVWRTNATPLRLQYTLNTIKLHRNHCYHAATSVCKIFSADNVKRIAWNTLYYTIVNRWLFVWQPVAGLIYNFTFSILFIFLCWRYCVIVMITFIMLQTFSATSAVTNQSTRAVNSALKYLSVRSLTWLRLTITAGNSFLNGRNVVILRSSSKQMLLYYEMHCACKSSYLINADLSTCIDIESVSICTICCTILCASWR